MQNASLSRSEKSLALARVRGNYGIAAVVRQMWRPVGPCGRAARLDVLAAADVGATLNEEDDLAAWVAHGNAKQERQKEKTGGWRGEIG